MRKSSLYLTVQDMRSRFPGLLLALIFFGAGLVTLNDFGVTWDEPETFNAGLLNVEALISSIKRGFNYVSSHELPGYYFFFDTLRGFFAKGMIFLGIMDLPVSFHFIHLILSALSVYLLYLLVLHISGRTRTAFFAALSLALFPKFIAHSQNNPKDLTGLFAFVLTLFLVIRWESKGRLWQSLVAGAVAGIAMTTHVACFFIPVIAGAWLVLTKRGRLRQEWGWFAVLSGTAALSFFIFWPWLWPDPLHRFSLAFKMLTTFSVNQPLIFFGDLYTWTTVPWYYFLGSFIVTTPLLYLALALAALPFLFRKKEGNLAPLKQTAALGAIWCGVLALAELRSMSHYDGIRHFLMFLPGFCILISVGAEAFLLYFDRLSNLKAPVSRLAPAGLILLCTGYLFTAYTVVQIHPYEDAYLNEATNALVSGQAEDYFEIEYWGNTYKEGAAWLNRNAEPDAVIYCVFSAQVNYHLKQPAMFFDPEKFFQNPGHPQYLILMTRKAWFDANIMRIDQEYQPVFTIKRQKGTLLKIYKNTVKKVPVAVVGA